jgi:molybdate transport system substrate-binding protein
MLQIFPARFFTAAIFAVATATSAVSADIKVLDANALTPAMKELAAGFTKESGIAVDFVGVSPGQVEQRIKAGEVYDLVITATASATAFEKEGRWLPGSRHPLARVGIGVAVREGVKVDLATVESTRRALLDAKTITYSDSSTGGLSGVNAQKVLANLGITDAVKAKTRLSTSLADGQTLIAKAARLSSAFSTSAKSRARRAWYGPDRSRTRCRSTSITTPCCRSRTVPPMRRSRSSDFFTVRPPARSGTKLDWSS